MPYDYTVVDDLICDCVKNFRQDSIPSGRPSWYGHDGVMERPFVIGISGGSGSGKSTVSNNIIKALSGPWVAIVTLDSFYKQLNAEQRERAFCNEYDFDHPDAIDHECAADLLYRLKHGKKVEIPIYNFTTHSRMKETKTTYGANIIILEGIFALHFEKLRDLMDLKIFIDTDGDIRFTRRLKRDVKARGRDIEGIIKQYLKFVKPNFEKYVIQSKENADMIINWNKKDDVSISIIVKHVRRELVKRGVKLRKQLRESVDTDVLVVGDLSFLFNYENEPYVEKFIHQIKSESIDDVVLYDCCRSLATYLLKIAIADVNKRNFTNVISKESREVVAVTLLRSGKIFACAFEKMAPDIITGLIYIRTNVETDEPELHNLKLPRNIYQKKVILMEGFSRSGAALTMAIRVLLEHDVKEEDIYVVILFVEKTTICSINRMFPRVNMFCTGVDVFIDSIELQKNIFDKLKMLSDNYIGEERGIDYSG